jgi:hypothetical protein
MKTFAVTTTNNLLGGHCVFTVMDKTPPEDIQLGEEIKLVDRQGQDVSYATVRDKWVGLLGHVPALMLEMHHDALQRTFSGIDISLQLCADVQTGPETMVTLLIIEPKKSTLIRPTLGDIKRAKN